MTMRVTRSSFGRRLFLKSTAASGLAVMATGLAMPRLSRAADRPLLTHGVQTGDMSADGAVLWARADRPATAIFEWSTTESFANPTRLPALAALPGSDFTAKIMATGLPSDQDIFWRVVFQNLDDTSVESEPAIGRFRTAPTGLRDVSFVWTGDTVGQGWGIDVSRGGMVGYAAMLKQRPDFFLHSGDNIYADGPLKEEVDLADGTKWKNIVTPEKSKVAETLDEFRGQYKYNLMDENVQALYAAVPVIAQWDDHEVSNNYSASKVFDDRYTEKSVAVLAARAHQAFHEFMPIAAWPEEPQRVYRKVAYGPLLDVFVIDMRTYRGPNGTNLETEEGGVAAFLGTEQLAWLKRALVSSRATWKVIAADMPLSLMVPDVADQKTWEAVANADPGAPLGRELEFADLLRTIKAAKIRNTVWLTADVHYTAAHYYDPNKAVFQDFDPFWEFVSGPIHAGSFGPNDLDPTFGPEARFVKAPSPDQAQGIGPAAGLQFFGHVAIAADTRVMTVTLRDTADNALWSIDLEPAMA